MYIWNVIVTKMNDDLLFSNLNEFTVGVILKPTVNLDFLNSTWYVSKLTFKFMVIVLMDLPILHFINQC